MAHSADNPRTDPRSPPGVVPRRAPTPAAASRPDPRDLVPGRFDLATTWASAAIRRPGSRAFAAYGALALAANWPIWPGDPSRIPRAPGGDVVQTVWFLAWTPQALLHGHNLFATSYLNYPRGVDLAQNTGMPLLGVLTAPLTLAVSPVASLNLLRFLAFALSGFAAFSVARRFTSSPLAAFAAGLVYGFSPYIVAQGQDHLNLSFVPLPPILLYLTYDLLVGRRTGVVRRGALLGLVAAAQYLISAEVLATTCIVAAAGGIVLGVLDRRRVAAGFARSIGGITLAAGVAVSCIAYPLWMSLRGPDHYTGAAQWSHNVYNADLLGPLVPTADMLLAPARLAATGSRLVGRSLAENGSYLSVPLLILVVVLVARDRRRRAQAGLLAVAAVAFVLSLGPHLVVDRQVVDRGLHLPFFYLARLPLLENMLAVRFSLYVIAALALVIARGLDAELLARRAASSSRRGRGGRIAVALLGGAALVTIAPHWPYAGGGQTVKAAVPTGLSHIPAGSVTLTYPYPTIASDDAMLWQAVAGMRFRLVGGYALERAPHGRATVSPAVLRPASVEGMLVDSITIDDRPRPVTDPSLPHLLATPRSLTPLRVEQLREFIEGNGVDTVVVATGRPDSTVIESWFTRALGPPSSRGGGAAIWLHAGALARPERL